MLLSTFMGKFLCGHIFSTPGVELLGQNVKWLNKKPPDSLVVWLLLLTSYWQPVRILIFLHPHQHLLLSAFFMTAILGGLKWYLIVLLICISPMRNNIKHLFMYLLATCTYSLDKSLFKSFTHFTIRIFVFLIVVL